MLRAVARLTRAQAGALVPGVVPYRSGSWIGIGSGVAPVTTAALAANVMLLVPLPIRWAVTVDQVQFTVGVGVAGNARFGLYRNLANGIGPDTLIAAGNAAVDTNVTGAAAVGFVSNPLLAPPLVWCAVLADAAAQFTAYPANGVDPSYAAELIGGLAANFVAANTATGRSLRASVAATYASGLPASATGYTFATSASAPIPTLRAV